MKLYDIILAADPLQKLISQTLPLRAAYQIAMLATRVNPHLQFYGDELAKGRSPDELAALEIPEMDVLETPHLFLAWDIKLSPGDIKRLEPFIVFEEGEVACSA